VIVGPYLFHHTPEHRLRADILLGICCFEIVVGQSYPAVDIRRNNHAVLWSRLVRPRKSSIVIGIRLTCQMGKLILVPNVKITKYFAFREISLR
jgi:hypothetical protein